MWVSHPTGTGFDFIATAPLLLSCYGFFFVFGPGVSLVVSHVVLLMVVQQLIGILVLGGDERTSFYSAISNQNLYRFLTVDSRCPLKRAQFESCELSLFGAK